MNLWGGCSILAFLVWLFFLGEAPISDHESMVATEEVSQTDELSDPSCRYSHDPIPYRDLSEYVLYQPTSIATERVDDEEEE